MRTTVRAVSGKWQSVTVTRARDARHATRDTERTKSVSCVALGSGVAGHPERVADCFGGWEVAGQADGVCGRGGAGPCVRVRVGWGCGLVDGLPAVAEGAFVACHACELFDASDVVVGCSVADAGCEAGCVRVQAVEEFASGHWVMAFRGRAASSPAERVLIEQRPL